MPSAKHSHVDALAMLQNRARKKSGSGVRSYRLISRELELSKNTVLEIVKRNRAMSA
jgi:DNA-binding Lrp family transcriptional regulator